MYKLLPVLSVVEDGIFDSLLEFCKRHCHTFSVEWSEGRETFWYDRVPPLKRTSVNEDLKPFLVKEKCIDQWGGVNTYRTHYQLNNDSALILKKARSLYLWPDPNSPKNLSFYVEDKLWMFSKSDDQIAYIYPAIIPTEVIENELSQLDFVREKPKFQIDGQNFSNLEEFYEEISEKLIPGSSWGRNLDAFDDVLFGGFGTPEHGFVLVWQNSDVSRQNLGYPETVKQLELRRKHCHPGNIQSVEENIENARHEVGPTVFDWLVEIVERHELIDLILR